VSVFSRLAVTSASVGESEKVLDAFNGVRIVIDNWLAVVELIQ
jgi:hypothetical protein